jgi:2-C-methyl-D-erythritol 2,4-cyclodiphosphate synthase
MRIGQGYDAHRIKPGNGIILGGIPIECDYSIEAHSDGDIIVHALIDALLGAAAYGDLGTYFPSEDESIKDISSLSMLSTVLNKLEEDNYKIMNIDLTYVGQVPKLITYREEIRNNLSKVTKIDIENISCKATTTDGLGFEGKFEGISCHCVVLIER